jgi:hypothetical protein
MPRWPINNDRILIIEKTIAVGLTSLNPIQASMRLASPEYKLCETEVTEQTRTEPMFRARQ